MPSVLHPVCEVPGVKEAIGFVQNSAVLELPVPWPRCQDLVAANFAKPTKDDLVVAVSHAWPYQVHPDPLGQKVQPLVELTKTAMEQRRSVGNTLLFVDLLSVPQRPFALGQRPRSAEEDERFAVGLKAFPMIYLIADVTVHLDPELSEVPHDGEKYSVPVDSLRRATVLQLGPSIQVVDVPGEDVAEVMPFDFVSSLDRAPLKSMEDLRRALDEAPARPAAPAAPQQEFAWPLCACGQNQAAAESCAHLQRAPFGKRNLLSADVKGWIYLERFASMVKVAMTDVSQIHGLVFSNKQDIIDQIFAGGARMRDAAGSGNLSAVLKTFEQELNQKQFTGVSIDKQQNTGGMGGLEEDKINAGAYSASDKDVVFAIMQEMTQYLEENWADCKRAQEHRQLVLAVGRQDIEALSNVLASRADPNTRDSHGMTVLHEAAKGRAVDIAKVLLEYGASTLSQDLENNIPAHKVFLCSEEKTAVTFRLMCPTRQELEHQNIAGLTPLRRFKTWAGTASDGNSYQPGMDLVAECLAKHPGILYDTENQGDAECEFDPSVCEILDNVAVGARSVPVTTWERPDPDNVHVLCLACNRFLPQELNLQGMREVANRICSKFKVKMFMLSWDAFDLDFLTKRPGYPEFLAHMQEVIEALPLNQEFVLLDDSIGDFAPLLWKFRQRLAGAMIINLSFIFSPDFGESEMFKKVDGMTKFMYDNYSNRKLEVLKPFVGAFTYSESKEALEPIQKRWSEVLDMTSGHYWEAHTTIFGWHLLYKNNLLATLGPLDPPLPVVLAVGDQAPDLIALESSQHGKKFFGTQQLDYIQNDKALWGLEGVQQRSRVQSLLAGLLTSAAKLSPEATRAFGEGEDQPQAGKSGKSVAQGDQKPDQCCALQ